MATFIHNLIPYGVVLVQAGAVGLLLGLLFARESAWIKWVGKNALLLSFLTTLAAVSGSLFYSNVIGYEPCILCWWQRIFMYPQVILFGTALWQNNLAAWQLSKLPGSLVFVYSLSLSIIGALIAIYHILLPYLEAVGIDCGTTGVSCTKQYVFEFGYITIPVMSLTVFATLILLALSNRYAK